MHITGTPTKNEKAISRIYRLIENLAESVPEENEVPAGFTLTIGYSLSDIAINRFDRPKASIKPTIETMERFERCEWPHEKFEENTKFIRDTIKFLLN